MIRKPSDIGYSDDQFILPELKINKHVIPYTGPKTGLFVEVATTLEDRRNARRDSIADRVRKAGEIINRNGDIWLVWCNLNTESDSLKRSINNAIEVKGADSVEHKERSILDFANGKVKCLVTKPKIAGFGMNLQVCNHVVFLGLSDSYEQFYQAVRRCWRFGQSKTVDVHIITGQREGAVVENIKRKESEMNTMFDGVIENIRILTQKEIGSATKDHTEYKPIVELKLPSFLERL